MDRQLEEEHEHKESMIRTQLIPTFLVPSKFRMSENYFPTKSNYTDITPHTVIVVCLFVCLLLPEPTIYQAHGSFNVQ